MTFTAEMLIVAQAFWYTFGVVYFLKAKNGWYPDTIKFWLFKLVQRFFSTEHGMNMNVEFMREVATTKNGNIRFKKPHTSWENWFRLLWGCVYCIGYWIGLYMLIAVYFDVVPTPLRLFFSSLTMVTILYEIHIRFFNSATEPDISQIEVYDEENDL